MLPLHVTSSTSLPPAAAVASIYRHPGFLSFISARLMAVFATQVQAVVVAAHRVYIERNPQRSDHLPRPSELRRVTL